MPSLDYACPTCRAAGALTPTPSPRRDAKIYRCRECDLLTTEPHRLVWAVYLDGELDWLSWFAFEAERQTSADHWRVRRTENGAELRPVFDGQTVAPSGRWKGKRHRLPPLLYRLMAGGGRSRRDSNLNSPDVCAAETGERVEWIVENWPEPEIIRALASQISLLPIGHLKALSCKALRPVAPLLLKSDDVATRQMCQRLIGRHS